MYCPTCKHEMACAMVKDWALGKSLRTVAAAYNVGCRSLQRHLDLCLASILSKYSENAFSTALHTSIGQLLKDIAGSKSPARCRRSIIKIPVPFTWSRRAWKKFAKFPDVMVCVFAIA